MIINNIYFPITFKNFGASKYKHLEIKDNFTIHSKYDQELFPSKSQGRGVFGHSYSKSARPYFLASVH